MDIQSRINKARALLGEWKADGLLVGSPANRRWLSGFTGSTGWLLITENAALITTDFRYWERVQQEAPLYTLVRNTSQDRLPTTMLRESGVRRVVVESSHITVSEFEALRAQAGNSFEWLKHSETVESLRAVKTEDELALIRRAAEITDQAIALVPKLARPGITEGWLAWQLEKEVRELGADGVAFDIIVASGSNAALPHHHPGNRELQAGDAIVVDMGALSEGYRSDLTRTFFLGSEADATFLHVYNLVLEAQTNALLRMRPGMTCQAIDALARDVIREADHEQHFGHGLGHGVGLDIHERPWLSPSRADEIAIFGTVVTVEPGVYIPGWGGVRIEDLVLLTEQGPVVLSRAPKEPLIPLN